MADGYRQDGELEFLRFCEEDDLRVLTKYLTHDKDGLERIASTLLVNDAFKRDAGDAKQHQKHWRLIAAELQHFGGDTIVNAVRGTGVSYREIVTDVCDKLGVKVGKGMPVAEMERALLSKLLEDAWEKLDDAQRRELLTETGISVAGDLAGPAALAAVQVAIKMGGFAAYRFAAVIANAVAKALLGRGLALAGNQMLMRTLSMFAGPIGWAITALTTVPAISGPAYRVTIPAVIQVAYMRLAQTKREQF
jgi:uncharacterized protein YaaW (UPF0174 family)